MDRSEVTDIVRATVTTSIFILNEATEAIENCADEAEVSKMTTAAIERIIEKAVDLLVNDDVKVGSSV